MSPESQKTKICPTCGTRLSENATRCAVCGTVLGAPSAASASRKEEKTTLRAAQMPTITLSLPAALSLFLLMLLLGAVGVFFGLRSTGRVVEPTPQPTATHTPTITPTPTEAPTITPTPTLTPLPPFEYTVGPGDTCISIAATFNISYQSIIILNNLPSSCPLYQGQKLKIPYPTPTVPPPPTSTPLPEEATRQACEQVIYTVQENDTLSKIALNYAVPAQAIKEWNGLSTDVVFTGQPLRIPLCKRAATPGPSPTPTIPPPYPAPNLLLPLDGAAFTLAHDAITLQWASLGVLRENEAYQIIIEDVTADEGRRLVDYVTETRYIVPTTFRPTDLIPHVFRWWVVPVRRIGNDAQGEPIWTPAGAASEKRVFTWSSLAVPVSTPTP